MKRVFNKLSAKTKAPRTFNKMMSPVPSQKNGKMPLPEPAWTKLIYRARTQESSFENDAPNVYSWL